MQEVAKGPAAWLARLAGQVLPREAGPRHGRQRGPARSAHVEAESVGTLETPKSSELKMVARAGWKIHTASSLPVHE